MKLTTTRLFVGLFALTAIAVISGLLWLSGRQENSDEATMRGPAQVMRKMKQRQKIIMEQERRTQAEALENATHDAALSGAAAK